MLQLVTDSNKVERGTVIARAPGVFTVDELLLPQHQLSIDAFLRAGGWQFGWKSNKRGGDQYSFWHRHFAGHRKAGEKYDCTEELKSNAPLIYAMWSGLSHGVCKGHALYRCYANGQSYGSEGTLHTDTRSPHGYTSIYYPHQAWQPNWGGETVIFNYERSDIVAAIYPRPNRMLVFRGDMPHVARAVARTCPHLRVTLMFKSANCPIAEMDGDDDD